MTRRSDTSTPRSGPRPEATWDGPPLAPTRDLVAFLIRGRWSDEPSYGWTLPEREGDVGADVLRPLRGSPPRLGDHEETPISGRAVLRDVARESGYPGGSTGPSVLQWFDFSTAQSTVVPIPPRAAGAPVRQFTAHAGARLVAIAEPWVDQAPGSGEIWARMRLSVHVAPLDGMDARLLATFLGGWFADEDSSSLQWSPDATAIAFCRRWVDLDAPEKGWHRAVVVLSARDGTLLASWPDVSLAGTASWSPDSRRLLIQPEGRTTAVQDVFSDRRVPVDLPPRRSDGFRGRRALGLVDDDRVVVMDDTSGPTVLSIDTLDGQHSHELVRWRTSHPSFPRVSALGPDVWDRALSRAR